MFFLIFSPDPLGQLLSKLQKDSVRLAALYMDSAGEYYQSIPQMLSRISDLKRLVGLFVQKEYLFQNGVPRFGAPTLVAHSP